MFFKRAMKFKKIYFVFGLLFCLSCGSNSESPEGVTRSFVELSAAGKCDEAKMLTIEEGVDGLENFIDSGCETFVTEVLEVHCKVDADTAWCCCHERRDDYSYYQQYNLEKIEGNWKISNYQWKEFILECWAENPWWEK